MNPLEKKKAEILERMKSLHADMFKGRVSALYVDEQLSKALDEYGDAVVGEIERMVEKAPDPFMFPLTEARFKRSLQALKSNTQ